MTADRRVGLNQALRDGARRLADAGVASPRADVRLLAAHLLGITPGQVQTAALTGAPVPDGLDDLIEQRAQRIPLQHLTGVTTFRRVELAVGPGAFVPRPETELLAGAAIEELHRLIADGLREPLLVDLCTGAGPVPAAVRDEVPGAAVVAIEADPLAHAWAARNLPGVDLRLADAREVPPDLRDAVHVVTCNPPYIPDHCRPLDPEVRDHDPELALYGGPGDGLALPLQLADAAAGLLGEGGLFVVEHGEEQQPRLTSALSARGWAEVTGHPDLSGRPRFVTARRAAAGR